MRKGPNGALSFACPFAAREAPSGRELHRLRRHYPTRRVRGNRHARLDIERADAIVPDTSIRPIRSSRSKERVNLRR